jgi:hypothetical protein
MLLATPFILPQKVYALDTFPQYWYFPIGGSSQICSNLHLLNTGSQTISYMMKSYFENGTTDVNYYSIGPSRYLTHILSKANFGVMIRVDMPYGYDGFVTPQLSIPATAYDVTFSGENKLSTNWYYAHGYIGDFADGLVGLLNIGGDSISVTIDVYGMDGAYQTAVSVDPHSVKYQSLKSLPGVIQGDIAIRVSSINYFAASYRHVDSWNGIAAGDGMAESTHAIWYFARLARFYSNGLYHTFLLHILNPSTATANVVIDFGDFSYTFSINPNRKFLWIAPSNLPEGVYSVDITSDVGIVATLEDFYSPESQIFGSASNNGASMPATDWFYAFAYGWNYGSAEVSVFNPSLFLTAALDAVLYYSDGSTSTKSCTLPPRQRQDLDFYDADQEYFGLRLHSNTSIVAQEYLWWYHENTGTLGSTMAKLTMHVCDVSGTPLSGAGVSVRYDSENFIPTMWTTEVASGTTDSNGVVIFPLCAAETYKVTAAMTSYYSSSSVVSLTFDEVLTLHLSPSGGNPGGCPYISTWNGTQWLLDNNLIPSAEYTNGTDVIDFYKLQQPLALNNGKYSLKIWDLDKHSFLDQVKLLAVDHKSDVNIAVSPSGEILTYKDPAPLATAIDQDNQDVSSILNTVDENYYEGNAGDSILIDFGNLDVSKGSKLVLRTDYCPFPCKSPYSVHILNATGSWIDAASIIPRMYWSTDIVDLSNYLPDGNGEVKLKLYFTATHKIDYVGMDTTKQGKFELSNANLVTAIHNQAGDVKELLQNSDNLRVELLPGDYVTLRFNAPQLREEERDFIIILEGHYFIIN